MKKLIILVIAIMALLFALPAGAVETEVDSTAQTVADTVVEDTTIAETAVAETTTVETAIGETEEAISTEALIEIGEDMSFSEVVLAIADKFGISIEEAEKMVGNIRELGDKYLSDSDLWDHITADMDANPAKWTIIGLAAALILFLIGLLIKRVISDATSISRIKVAIAGIEKAISGDDAEDGEISIRTMINEKNDKIKMIENDNAVLLEKTEKLEETVRKLCSTIGKMESNSDTSAKITEESALQILQLLNLALDRKMPVTSKEARALWYSATQNKIKSIYEEGVTNAENAEQDGKTEQTGETV